jgi:hypothetical protein
MSGILDWLGQLYQSVLNSDFWWVLLIIVVLGFIVFLSAPRWFAKLLEYYFERLVPAKRPYVFELVVMLVVILLGVNIFLRSTNFAYYWQSVTMAGALGAVGAGIIYQRMLNETGCPSCHNLLPYRRKEISRSKLRQVTKESLPLQRYQSFGIGFQKPFLQPERSWDEYIVRKYRIDRVDYKCVSCNYQWNEEESVLIDKFDREIDQAPEAYRNIHGSDF